MLLSATNGAAPLAAGTTRVPPPAIRAQAPEVENVLKTLNAFTPMVPQDVSFTMDKESGKTIVKA